MGSIMNKQIRNRIITVVVIVLIVGFGAYLRWTTKIKYYKDETITGNTSTNLLNGGLFAKDGDKIYFANPYDQNAIYSMNEDLSKPKKIYEDYASYINAAGDYIFYTRRNDQKGNKGGNAFLSLSTTGLYRITKSGGAIGQLYRDPTQTANLLGNHVYYQHYDQEKGLQLFSIGIDGKEDTMLVDEAVSPTVIVDGTIYYTGMGSDHDIHTINIDGTASRTICEGNFTGLAYANGSLYCLDMDNDYTLCRLNTTGSDLVRLTQDRVVTYNVTEDGSTIFFQVDNGTNNGLYVMDADGSSAVMLRAGNFNFYHIIDNYLFFEDYDGSAAYVMDVNTEQIEDFEP